MKPLVTTLLDLSSELPTTPLIVGGGFGLYLQQQRLERREDIDTMIRGDRWPPARATEDVDLFLPTEVIVSAERARAIREALDRLGFESIAEHFQFQRVTELGTVRLDLLTCDIPKEHADKVKVKGFRVRPLGGVRLHAFLTREALALDLSPREFLLAGERSDGKAAEARVLVPNAFTYLLMKLHALRDRVDDPTKSRGAHHAVDIYRIVAMMNRDDYDFVLSQCRVHRREEVMVAAIDIVREFFGSSSRKGMLRLLDGAAATGLPRSTVAAEVLIDTLGELFQPE
ncbi:MAG: nucleotidyl transferase AbiEii/AbiGii toxin family protein [Planctomycetota bacterium]